MAVNAKTEMFDHIELFGKPALLPTSALIVLPCRKTGTAMTFEAQTAILAS